MKILMCLQGSFPPDARVDREAQSLIQAGHEVFLLCRQTGNALDKETIHSINVIRIRLEPSFLTRRFVYACQVTTFKHPLWEKAIRNAVREHNIEVIHVHDLPLAATATSVAGGFGLPVIADLHEMYSAAYKLYAKSLWKRRLLDLMRWKQQEQQCLTKADRVITISEGGRDFYLENYEFPPDKLVVVMNTVDLDEFYSFPIDQKIIERYRPYFLITYTGSVSGPHRGIQTAVAAMPKIVSRIPNARLLVVGGLSKATLLRWIDADSARDAMEKYLILAGWQDHSSFPSYISASSVCIVPHVISSVQTDAAVPNKIFEYMAMAKPVIVSSGRALQKIVEESGAGLIYPSGDADAFADAVIRLHDDKDLARKFGKAGLAAVKARYSWEAEAKKLIVLYQGLADDRRQQGRYGRGADDHN